MSLHSATVLALVLCLGWTINTQHESLQSPSIMAHPGLEISQGNSVKFVCTSPVEYDTFRLEKRSTIITDKKNDLPSKKQAVFQLGPVNETTAGSYQCLYQKGSMWSQRSETLELKVTSEDVTHTSDPVSGVTSESLLSPSIMAHPGLEIPQGHSVKFVCTSPIEYDTFRLEKRSTIIMNKMNDLSSKKQAVFQLGPVNEDTAGSYQCLYQKGSMWSQRSETLELKVISEDVTCTSDPVPGVTSDTSWLKTNSIYILIGAAVVFLLCLLLFLLFCFHSHRQKKQGLPNSKSQEHTLQKRLSLVTNGLESTPDIVTDDLLPEDKRTETLIPAAGGLQEVTYAQLDHHALTQRIVGDVTPRSTETMTDSSTYAAIIRR